MVLAGGLHADNVGAAIARVRPWGVDAVSGVEAAPGRKDPRALRAFISAARAAAPSDDEQDDEGDVPYDWQEDGG
jgi:phosphoribosylanthranilate isomerase